MQGLTDSLFDEIKGLSFEDNTGEQTRGFKKGSKRNGKLKKRKVRSFDFDTLKLLHENINNYTLFKHWICTFISVQLWWMCFVASALQITNLLI
jgi:hypothetical protein